MKRAKVGDVYSVKIPNGYKIYQWAYSIPRKGDYIRVFDGIYNSIPCNIEKIVGGPHSYIIPFYSSRAYKSGLAKLIANYPIPEKYPFPSHMIRLCRDMFGEIYQVEFTPTNGTLDEWQIFPGNCMGDFPYPYSDIRLLGHVISPNWLLYLFDIDFNLSNLHSFFPCKPGEDAAKVLRVYTDIVNSAYVNSNSKK